MRYRHTASDPLPDVLDVPDKAEDADPEMPDNTETDE